MTVQLPSSLAGANINVCKQPADRMRAIHGESVITDTLIDGWTDVPVARGDGQADKAFTD